MNNFFTTLTILLAIMLISGCADQEPQKVVVPQKIAKPSVEVKPGADVAAPLKEPAVAAIGYEYNPKGRRDPFTSLIVKDTADKKKGVGPLEQDDIKTFRLIAIVRSGDQYYAMVTLPDGKSYTVKKGTKIGADGGIIESITKDSVVVRQLTKDKTGVLKPKDIILRLRTEEQG